MNIFWQWLAWAGVLTLAAACQGPDPSSPNAGTAQSASAVTEAHTPPKALRLPLDGPVSTLDPGQVQSQEAIELTEQLFLGLTDFAPDTYHTVPELAQSWEADASGMSYVFHLRQDVKWSNEEPVTAHDVVWAIRRNILPETRAPMAYSLFILKNAEAIHKGKLKDINQLGVRAEDDYTLRFDLENPAVYFPAMASLGVYRPLHRVTLEKFGNDWTLPEHIVTNGAYRLAEWKKSSRITLEKNPLYFDERKVAIAKVHYYIVAESSLGLAMYEADELDVLGAGYLRVPEQQLPRIQSDPKLRREHRQAALFCNEAYAFNTELPPVDNPLVRKALTAAINRNLLIDFVVRSHEAAQTFTRPPILGSIDPSENVGISFSEQQAKAWLAEAGYANGKDLPPITLVHNNSETHRAIALAIQTFVQHYLQVRLNVREVNFDAYVDTMYDPKDVHMFRLGWCSDYPDANNWLFENFHPEKSPNFVRWHNREFAELVEQAQRQPEAEERIKLYHRAEVILVQEEAAVLPVYFSTANYLVKPRIKGWYSMPIGGQHIRNWSLQ